VRIGEWFFPNSTFVNEGRCVSLFIYSRHDEMAGSSEKCSLFPTIVVTVVSDVMMAE
jgi:hypothetical protein